MKTKIIAIFSILLGSGLVGIASLHAEQPAQTQTEPGTPPKLSAAYGKLPLSFEANAGQTDPAVRFLSRGSGYSLFLTDSEAVLVLKKKDTPAAPAQAAQAKLTAKAAAPSQKSTPAVLRMKLVGAKPPANVTGQGELAGKVNYFIGKDPAKWRTDAPTYSKVRYERVYSGIDLVYYGNQRQLEYDFVVAPGADPARIRLGFDGARKMRVDAHGDLLVETTGGAVRWQKPVVYQETSGARKQIEGKYLLRRGHQVGFEVASYDATKPLIIDPTLVYSTYLGGSGDDTGFGIAVDSSGNAYVTGQTGSTDFPTTAGTFQPALAGGGTDAFVTKLNAAGNGLVYSTYLGGSGPDEAIGIAVDSSGNAYVTGMTFSTDFPTTAGAFQTANAGISDVFVTKLNAAGNGLVYSTYLGGSNLDSIFDGGSGIAIDSSGNAYVTGYTFSTNFPTTAGAFQTAFGGGAWDAFVTKLNAAGTGLVYSTYLGGNGTDTGSGVAVDSSGNAYVTGGTSSTDFPTTAGAFQTAKPGITNAFVTKLNASGSGLLYSTYLGGSGFEFGYEIGIDSSGNGYVTGFTTSANFPTTAGAFQTVFADGGGDAFITELNASGSGLLYSTYLGGNGLDFAKGIALDSSGNAHVTGFTSSTNFPTTVGAFQTVFAGGSDAFVTKLDATGTGLLYSTYLGGSGFDEGNGIAVDSSGSAYVAGDTNSTNFPTTAGAFQTANAGSSDAFVAKFEFAAPPSVGKATGGGAIDVVGGTASFGFVVQRQTATGPTEGNLQYVNHVTGANVQSATFTTFTIRTNTATFSGSGTNNGTPCTFSVTVQDNGEPGKTDSFQITVTPPGTTEGGTLRSGNIQIHK
jgi:beta-propeller repeat-containing protein